MPDTRSATVLDADVRTHLAMLITVVQTGSDTVIAELAKMETHRMVAAILTALGDHRLSPQGDCLACAGPHCQLRHRISRSLLPVRLKRG